MKICIMKNATRGHAPRPAQPSVGLSNEAYDALLSLADRVNVSMRKLASAIILEACNDTLQIEKVGATDETH